MESTLYFIESKKNFKLRTLEERGFFSDNKMMSYFINTHNFKRTRFWLIYNEKYKWIAYIKLLLLVVLSKMNIFLLNQTLFLQFERYRVILLYKDLGVLQIIHLVFLGIQFSECTICQILFTFEIVLIIRFQNIPNLNHFIGYKAHK